MIRFEFKASGLASKTQARQILRNSPLLCLRSQGCLRTRLRARGLEAQTHNLRSESCIVPGKSARQAFFALAGGLAQKSEPSMKPVKNHRTPYALHGLGKPITSRKPSTINTAELQILDPRADRDDVLRPFPETHSLNDSIELGMQTNAGLQCKTSATSVL